MSRFVDLHRDSTGIREMLNAMNTILSSAFDRKEKNIYE